MWRDQTLKLIASNVILRTQIWARARHRARILPIHLDSSYEEGLFFCSCSYSAFLEHKYDTLGHIYFSDICANAYSYCPINTFWYLTQDSKYIHSEKKTKSDVTFVVIIQTEKPCWSCKYRYTFRSVLVGAGHRASIVSLPDRSCIFIVN